MLLVMYSGNVVLTTDVMFSSDISKLVTNTLLLLLQLLDGISKLVIHASATNVLQ